LHCAASGQNSIERRSQPELVYHQQLHHHVSCRRLEAGEPADLIDLYQGHGTYYVDYGLDVLRSDKLLLSIQVVPRRRFLAGIATTVELLLRTDGVFRQAESSCYREVTCEEGCEHGSVAM
jgi:hypothetical protein